MALLGTPVIRYGDEIGMGDNMDLPERHPVRTPMQWSASGHGGFSDADHKAWIRAHVLDGPFSHPFVNAEGQEIDETLILSTIQQLIRVRRAYREIGCGEIEVLDLPNDSIVGLKPS